MTIAETICSIIERHNEVPTKRSMLVGISGIDGSGKGFITKQINERLTSDGFRTAVINIDGWLNLPHLRFDRSDPARNFYRNGIRFNDMFEQLVLPLRETREVDLTADFVEETATACRKNNYRFEDIDIILLEGIFLFKREFIRYYDLKTWIDCSFEVALKRAIARSQEGLSSQDTVRAYERIYFRAQCIHFEIDDPRSAADVIIDNN